MRKVKIKGKTYLAEVESYRDEKGRVKQRFVRYIGKLVEGKVVPGKFDRLRVERVMSIGGTLLLKHIADELGLTEALDSYTNGNGDLILSLSIVHCLNPTSLNSVRRYLFNFGVDFALDLDIQEVSVKKMLNAMDHLDDSNFALQRKLFERICKTYGPPKDSLFYDITSVYFYGVKCVLAKKGYNSENLSLPQIGIGLAVDRRGFPIFHRVFEGNVHASKTLSAVMDEFRSLKIEKATLVLDRGMAAERTISEALKAGFDVIVGTPLRGEVKERAIKLSRKIVSPRNVIKLANVFVYAGELSWKGGKLVVCLNERERALMKEARYRRIYQWLESGKVGEVPKHLKRTERGYEIDEAALAKKEETDGLYAIFCNREELSREEILKAYFEKDLVEKSFRVLKGVLGISPIRHWLEHRVRAHVFICYLAYLLASVMHHKLRPLSISVPEALEEMKSVYKVVIGDPLKKTEFAKFSALTKRQEEMVRAVDPKILAKM